MKLLLDGKKVAENIKKDFENRIENLKQKPSVAVLGISGDEASLTYVKRIEKNCEKYGIGFTLKMAKNEEEFRKNFNNVSTTITKTFIRFNK